MHWSRIGRLGKLLIWVQIPKHRYLALCPHQRLREKGKWSLKWGRIRNLAWIPKEGPAEGGVLGVVR